MRTFLRRVATSADKPLIRLLPAAVQKLQTLQKDLLVKVDSGGCQGFQYEFETVDRETPPENHTSFQQEGVRVYVDEISAEFFENTEIDYVTELIRSQFEVVTNVAADMSCSCGASFSKS